MPDIKVQIKSDIQTLFYMNAEQSQNLNITATTTAGVIIDSSETKDLVIKSII